ncbi:hypothetical protein C8T65DRAFT_711900 [Cerioporus squamosus]|nr:hypothetical protein C8T65DRAFT_711900 [Cerioporus squamosus]
MSQIWDMHHKAKATSFNAYRDKISELGSEHFAAETNQELVTFYSETSLKVNMKWSTNIVHPELQGKLWNLPHASTDHHPGMPVMIKVNEAAECCVTNGAETTVDCLKKIISLSHVTRQMKCIISSSAIMLVNKDQVAVLPNFAITDFATQGQIRPDIVVDMHDCPHHQSVYTCLSWGATIDGIIIVQPFDIDKLSEGNLRIIAPGVHKIGTPR